MPEDLFLCFSGFAVYKLHLAIGFGQTPKPNANGSVFFYFCFMKTYFRVLAFAKPLEKYLIPFVVFAAFSSVFGALNLSLLIPMLDLLFGSGNQENFPTSPPIYQGVTQIGSYLNDYFRYWIGVWANWGGKMGALQFVCAAIVVATLLSNAFRFLYERMLELLRSKLITTMRTVFFNKVIALDLSHFSSNRKGDMTTRLALDVHEVDVIVNHSLRALIKEPIMIAVYFGFLFSLSVRLTLFTLVFIPISGGAVALIIRKLRKDFIQAQQAMSSMMSVADETFGSMRVIKSFNSENFMKQKFWNFLEQYRKAVLKAGLRRELSHPLSEFTGVLIVIGLVLYGGSLVLSEPPMLKASDFLTFIVVFALVIKPIKEVVEIFGKMQRSLVAAERIFEIIDLKPTITDSADALPVNSLGNGVEFRNVFFSYDNKKLVLKNICFFIPTGKTVALVGQSGSGKSTIADLLSRFYDPTQGAILINGTDIRRYRIADLRALSGVVAQEAILYNDTVAGNIAFGHEATQEQIEAAAKIANAHDFIVAMPQGYQTNIGERGSKLSGGQRQRISIARAVLRNPQLLILDEATSALDTESEKLVQNALDRLMQNRTALVIAHRLSTVQKADEIIVLHEGEIVERGTHSQLLKIENGVYRRLCESQELAE